MVLGLERTAGALGRAHPQHSMLMISSGMAAADVDGPIIKCVFSKLPHSDAFDRYLHRLHGGLDHVRTTPSHRPITGVSGKDVAYVNDRTLFVDRSHITRWLP